MQKKNKEWKKVYTQESKPNPVEGGAEPLVHVRSTFEIQNSHMALT